MAFTWEAKSYYSTKLTILLTFKYPGQISEDAKEKDKITVMILNPTMFLSEASLINVKN